jgi:GNAT superfamily N-acetyltransferase
MSRTTVPLTLDHLDELDDCACRGCLFWEVGPAGSRGLDAEERAGEKVAWFSDVLREWGSCGRVVLVDGRPVGYATYAPAELVEGARLLPTGPVSPDAVLLSALWVDPEHRGGGLARMLVQGMARDLVRRGCGAVEAFGERRPGVHGSCVIPAEFLGRVGFRTVRPHVTTPRMRMELRSTLRWREEVEQALEKLWGVVRPVPAVPRPSRPYGAATRGR